MLSTVKLNLNFSVVIGTGLTWLSPIPKWINEFQWFHLWNSNIGWCIFSGKFQIVIANRIWNPQYCSWQRMKTFVQLFKRKTKKEEPRMSRVYFGRQSAIGNFTRMHSSIEMAVWRLHDPCKQYNFSFNGIWTEEKRRQSKKEKEMEKKLHRKYNVQCYMCGGALCGLCTMYCLLCVPYGTTH